MWGWNLAHHEFKGVNPKLSKHQQVQTCFSLSLSLSVFVSLSTSLYPPTPSFSLFLEFCKAAGWTIKHFTCLCNVIVCMCMPCIVNLIRRDGDLYVCVHVHAQLQVIPTWHSKFKRVHELGLHIFNYCCVTLWQLVTESSCINRRVT